ncbi:hypothetical protein [Nocardioides pyridinolyticus]
MRVRLRHRRSPKGRPRKGRTVKFILVVVLVIVVAFLLFKYVLPGMRRR